MNPELSPSPTEQIVNVAAYKFVTLTNSAERREPLRELCLSLELKGTILLSPEGINLFVAGSRQSIDRLLRQLTDDPEIGALEVKESYSNHQPFSRMLVRLKREIIAFGVEGIEPAEHTAPKVSPQELKKWLDEGRPVRLLDVRNDYEVELGTFAGAEAIGVDHFRDFPAAADSLPEDLKDEKIVTFCTGGIRCEKAGPYLQQAGFKDVLQLDGGILKYFEECGQAHYKGECFVFDKRVALDGNLEETDTALCFACQRTLTLQEQQSSQYIPGESCPYCYDTRERFASRSPARDC